MKRRRKKNPAGFPLWMWAVGAGVGYWWFTRKKAVVRVPTKPVTKPTKTTTKTTTTTTTPPQETTEYYEQAITELEGLGYTCYRPR